VRRAGRCIDKMTLSLAILGDSIAYGQGASHLSDTIGARLVDELAAAGNPSDLRVFAVPGARSDALVTQVSQAIGWGADLAVIIIGANDLTHLVPPEQAAAALSRAVRRLRTAGAEVVVAPTPDLSAVPWVPARLRALVQVRSAQLRLSQTQAALSEGARIATVDGTTSAAFGTDLALFSVDRFHPSSAGYALISRMLTPAVLAAAADGVAKRE
jgi:lysophospholipase L1-like esterase